MLAGARARTTALGDAVTLVEGRAEALPFDDAAFDGLTFTYLLRYVDDVDATLAGLARVAEAGCAVRLPGVLRCRRAARCAGSGTSTPASACRSPAG